MVMTTRLAVFLVLMTSSVMHSAAADTSALDPETRISLREALLLALRSNIDIEVARTDYALAAQDVEAARGALDPVAQAEFGFDRVELLTANTLQASGGGSIPRHGMLPLLRSPTEP